MPTLSHLQPSLYPSGMQAPRPSPVATPPAAAGLKAPGTGYRPDRDREIGGIRFRVEIDGVDLGHWTTVSGLSVKFEMGEYRAGDANNHLWIEPAFTVYQTVRLGRATTLRFTQRIMTWLQETSFTSEKRTARITGFPLWHSEGSEDFVVTWDLRGVIPVAWSGPAFDAASGKLATETLELAHEGFLDADT